MSSMGKSSRLSKRSSSEQSPSALSLSEKGSTVSMILQGGSRLSNYAKVSMWFSVALTVATFVNYD